MTRFDDKVVFITGAAAGIGRATAVRIAEEGGSLYIVDLAEPGLKETAKLCSDLGAKVEYALCDVSDETQVKSHIQSCVDAYGKLDVLCNVAGILLLQRFDEITVDQFRKVLEVNLVGTFMLCQAALPHLLKSQGNIVNMSSTSALAGMPYGAAYGTSKGGVSALTRTLAVEFGYKGLRCNAINPGSIDTAMAGADRLPEKPNMRLVSRAMPLKQARGPETIASVIAMLASEDGAHINGEEIRVDDGTLA